MFTNRYLCTRNPPQQPERQPRRLQHMLARLDCKLRDLTAGDHNRYFQITFPCHPGSIIDPAGQRAVFPSRLVG